MKIVFIERAPGAHHQVREENGRLDVPRVGDLVALGSTVFTVHSVCWVREETTVQVMIDR